MRIAIVGSGVSGLVSALVLGEEHEVTVFEANDYIGGHTHTIDVSLDGDYAVDTGFIVFNDENYPGFRKLLKRLDVDSQPSSMSFSVKNEATGLEYGFATWNAVFAQRRNLLRPSFLRMLLEINRFRSDFKRLICELDDSVEIGAYLDRNGYSQAFRRDFLVPFGAAIWSAAPAEFERFPLRTFVQFFLNHGFLDLSRLLQWHVVKGGSHAYVKVLLRQLRGTVHTRTKVVAVRRDAEGVDVVVAGAAAQRFDQVVLACHSDQALAMLADASPTEREVLGAMPYQPNDVVLHTDTRLLPRHRHVWSAWNYCVPQATAARATLTYDMNILQGLSSKHEFLVSLNPSEGVDGELGCYAYDHPVYTTRGVAAQTRHSEISGLDKRTHFAGAYWGFGFHEDGVESARRVCAAFGKDL